MADLSNLAKDISKGRNLETGFVQYAAGLKAYYKRVGNLQLAFDLYMFAESLADGGFVPEKTDEFVRIMSGYYDGSKETYAQLISLREEIIGKMEILTAYTDRLMLYEYVLNRIEYNFKDDEFNPDYYNEKFKKDILNYVVSDKDNSVVRLKITQVVKELPMRLSKSKFFDLIKGALSLYDGGDLKSLNDFVYMIQSCAGLITPDGFGTQFAHLHELYESLGSFDYESMTKEDYDRAAGILSEASGTVGEISDMYLELTDCVNAACSVVLSGDDLILPVLETESCETIIRESLRSIDEHAAPDEALDAHLESLTGIQERLYTRISSLTYAVDDLRASGDERIGELGFDGELHDLAVLELLNSDSSFMSLEAGTDNGPSAGSKDVSDAYEKLNEELKVLFKNQSRPFNRAVMAAILGALPVFFSDIKELEEYVDVSLSMCKDNAERQACMALIHLLMEE